MEYLRYQTWTSESSRCVSVQKSGSDTVDTKPPTPTYPFTVVWGSFGVQANMKKKVFYIPISAASVFGPRIRSLHARTHSTMSFSQRDIATRETIPTPPQRYIPTPPDTQRAMSGTPSDVLRPTSTLLGELLTLAEAQVQARSHKPPRITCSTRYPPCPCCVSSLCTLSRTCTCPWPGLCPRQRVSFCCTWSFVTTPNVTILPQLVPLLPLSPSRISGLAL